MNPKVDEYFLRLNKWHEELRRLRMLVLNCGLTEELKWKQPCYMYRKKNILILSGFKNYCVISFFKGALLTDYEQILTMAGEDSEAIRQIRFTNTEKIERLDSIIKSYVFEAVEVEKAGLKIQYKDISEYSIPRELEDMFNVIPSLKSSFEKLTPGRQKAYIYHISGAKQAATRIARVEKFIPRILAGKGISDCICGLSKRMSMCDGSHKNL